MCLFMQKAALKYSRQNPNHLVILTTKIQQQKESLQSGVGRRHLSHILSILLALGIHRGACKKSKAMTCTRVCPLDILLRLTLLQLLLVIRWLTKTALTRKRLFTQKSAPKYSTEKIQTTCYADYKNSRCVQCRGLPQQPFFQSALISNFWNTIGTCK